MLGSRMEIDNEMMQDGDEEFKHNEASLLVKNLIEPAKDINQVASLSSFFFNNDS